MLRYLKERRIQEFVEYDDGIFGKYSYHPIGCVVTAMIDGKIRVGWSLCHKNDRFTKAEARKEAFGKLDKEVDPPHELKELVNHMRERAERYYKVSV